MLKSSDFVRAYTVEFKQICINVVIKATYTSIRNESLPISASKSNSFIVHLPRMNNA